MRPSRSDRVPSRTPLRRYAARLLTTSALAMVAVVAVSNPAAMAGGPTGGSVVQGSASITNPNANTTLIKQSTQKALINWQDFSVSQGSAVNFAQPNSSSITLNRVTGNTPSNIQGNLNANGQVWIINGNGILVGKTANINVGGLIATTSDMRDQDFASGNYNFGTASANPNASVVNQGTITTKTGGAAVLAGASVSNEGTIRANAGNVTLASGSTFTVDFTGDNLLRFAVQTPVSQAPTNSDGSAKSALVSNSGTISAPGGQVTMTARAASNVIDNVINNTGVVQATSVHAQNGEIVFDAGDGTADIGGTVDASGTKSGQTGGTVQVLGKTVNVADGANINVSGAAGGGTVLIGGNFHGAGPLPNAATTTVGKATITADATVNGNGGQVAVWSDNQTHFAGSISAKGGAAGGNGGQVETSGGHLAVASTATVDTSAAHGTTGNWLLDPGTIEIRNEDESGSIPSDGTVAAGDSPNLDLIDPSTVTNALETTDVTLEATNDIEVDNAVVYSSSHALSLLSEGDIVVSANIQNSGTGSIALVAGWDGTSTGLSALEKAGAYGNSDNGYIQFGNSGAGAHVGTAGGSLLLAGSGLSIGNYGSFNQIGYQGAGSGDITVLSTGGITLSSYGDGVVLVGNGDINGNGGDVSGNITIQAGNTIDLHENAAGNVLIGNTPGEDSTASGNVQIIGGSISEAGDAHPLEENIQNDVANGDVFVGSTDPGSDLVIYSSIVYGSAHTLSLASAGSLTIAANVENSDGGNINAVAGWDGTTTDPTKLGNTGVYGNNNGSVYVTSDYDLDPGDDTIAEEADEGEAANVAIGSADGTTTVGGTNVTVLGDYAPSQIGYAFGSSTGSIFVNASGNVALTASADRTCTGCYAQIGGIGGTTNGGAITVNAGGNVTLTGGAGLGQGNYAQIGNGGYGSSGNDGGNISVTAGTLSLTATAQGDYAQIGNGAADIGADGNAQGDISVHVANSTTLNGSSGGNALVGNVAGDGENAIESGNVSIITGSMDAEHLTSMIEQDLSGGNFTIGVTGTHGITIGQDFNYSSGNALTVMSAGDIKVDANIQNRGNGAVTLVAGWDGTTTDSTKLGNAGVYGNNSGNVIIEARSNDCSDECNGPSGVFVGSKSGATTVEGAEIDLYGDNGFAQIGYNDASTGDILVKSTGDVVLDSSNDFGQGYNYNYTQIGNGGVFVDGAKSGNVTVDAGGDVTLTSGGGAYNYAQIGNGGDTTTGNVSGSVIVNARNVSVTGGGDYAQIGNGGWRSANQGHGDTIGGDVTVTATGDVSLTGDPSSKYGDAQIGNGGLNNDDATIGGNVSVSAATLELTAGAESDYAQIGNGAANGSAHGSTISGDVTITVAGAATLGTNCDASCGTPWLGNYAANDGTESGNLTIVAASVDGDLSGIVLSALGTSADTGGDVTLGDTGVDSIPLDGNTSYSSPHTLSFLSVNDIVVTGSFSNTGSGAINLIAGWDGHTLTPSSFTTAGVYGNNGGSVIVGGNNASGSAAIGSAGGTLTAAGSEVRVEGVNGSAQLGYQGAGSGAIVADAVNAIALNGGTAAANTAEIGNSSTLSSNSGSGTVSLTANTISGANGFGVVATTLTTTVTGAGSGIGSATNGLHVTVDTLDVSTNGSSAYFSSPDQGLTIGSASLGAGTLLVNASGDVGQTGQIAAGALTVTSTGGAIALTNASNDVTGTVSLDAHGDAAFENDGAVALGASSAQDLSVTTLVGGIAVDGVVDAVSQMTLNAADAISEGASGSVAAATLNATSTNAGIALGNANDVTGTVVLTAKNGAVFENSVATTLGASSAESLTVTTLAGGIAVSGAEQASSGVTLQAAGDVTEGASGSIAAATLNASSSGGNVALGNATNSVSGNVTLAAKNTATFKNAVATTLGASSAQNLNVTALAGGIAVNGAEQATAGVTLQSIGDITEGASGSIKAATLSASSSGGNVALGNAANSVSGTVTLAAKNTATFKNAVATTLGASSAQNLNVTALAGGIAVNGAEQVTAGATLQAAGDITEGAGGSITAATLNATSSGGNVALGSTTNSVSGNVVLSANNTATFENAVATTLGASSAQNLNVTALNGGLTLNGAEQATSAITLQAAGDITEGANGSIAASTLAATSTGGAIVLTNAANDVTGSVALSAKNNATFENAVATTLGASSAQNLSITALAGGIAVNGADQASAGVTLQAVGDITEGAGGSIAAATLNATSSGGGIALGNAANNVSGTVTLSAKNTATFENAVATTLGASSAQNLNVTALAGNLTLNGAESATSTATFRAAGITEGAGGSISAATLSATGTSGALSLTNAANSVATAQLSAGTDVTFYDGASVTLASVAAGGNATVLSKGAITVPASIQLSSGALTLVAGWDGTTTAAASLGNAGVFGNNGNGVTIGGGGATAGVAVGSQSGATTVEGAGVQLAAVDGYAMIGTHGAGSGAITVDTTGNVTLTGGAGADDFAQIGNGGQGVSGNDSGNVTVAAGGNVVLNGGSGTEAYAQIGHGGAESNAASSGYTNTGTISVTGTNATLTAGSGSGAYAQVGQGGFKVGEQLASGTATNSGDVSVVVTHDVSLNGGGGNDAYAQVGNGGDQSNTGASASAHTANTGNITVTAPNGPNGSVTLAGGNGTDAYAEIGNGGFGNNSGTTAAPGNFLDSGNVSVSDLTLAGGNGGSFAYSQIGNGDATGHGVGNVSGNIAIDANGNITIIPGTSPGSTSFIGNDTGTGTVTGTTTGYVSPADQSLTSTVASLSSNTQNTINSTTANAGLVQQVSTTTNDNTIYSASFLATNDKGENAIATLSDGGNEEQTSSDSLTVTVADSLTKSKGSNFQVVIIGLLTQTKSANGKTPHGVPPVDQEYSSWGNEAFWQ